MAKMPVQKPGRSRTTYATPRGFLDAVERRLGKIRFDLAADSRNAVATRFYSKKDDALTKDWTELRGLLWLNPPYDDIAPWAQKCAESRGPGSGPPRSMSIIALLTPASVGSNWFAEHVHGKALVLALRPRLSFDGKNPYPKDLILSLYDGEGYGFETWRWRGATAPRALLTLVPGGG